VKCLLYHRLAAEKKENRRQKAYEDEEEQHNGSMEDGDQRLPVLHYLLKLFTELA
jgi:hypothetical protein